MRGAAAVLFLCGTALWAAQVQVSEQTITLPTWTENPPDITAFFNGTYPYAMRNGIGREKREESWRVLVLENEYLRCRVLPDLAGRLYGCLDKRNNREMFFANSSIRKAMIGLRGAWIAAGVEPNFPAGHTRDAVSPVDFAMRQNADGSASVTTGSTDRVSGMRWQTEFVLHPGECRLQERVALYNPTPVAEWYQWWNNAAVLLRDPKTRFILPTYLVSTHGGAEIDKWPVNSKGIDISAVASAKEHDAAWFAFGSKEPFEAVYQPGSRTATVHVADPQIEPGKKTYTWGSAGDQQVRDTLTDDGSTYVEMQAGLFQNQDTFQRLLPQQARDFTEYWIPVRSLGGISRASRDAVLSIEPRGASLEAALEVTRALPRARITVVQNGHALLDEPADLDPLHLWSKTIAGYSTGTECRIELRDATGTVLLAHTLSPAGKDVYDALTPDRVQLGAQPRPSAAAKDNDAPEAAVILRIAQRRYAEALRELKVVREKTPGDPESQYYLGVAHALQGNDAAAEPELRAALQYKSVYTGAAIELGALLVRRGAMAEAVKLFHSVGDQNPDALRAGELEVATLRRQRRLDAARERVRAWLARAPQDPMLRLEAVLLGAHDDTLWRHLGANTERVLDIAAEYVSLGAWNDALALLSRDYPPSPPNQTEAGNTLPQQNVMVAYYRAYCRMRLAQSPGADLKLASTLPTRYVFPGRATDRMVLEAVLTRHEEDGTAHLLLGYMFMAGDERARALEQWHRAELLRPDLPALEGLLAKARLQGEPTVAVAESPRSVPGTPLRRQEKTTVSVPAASTSSGPHQIAAEALLRSVTSVDDALAAFTQKNFPGEKQDEFVRRVWIELRLQRLRVLARGADCNGAVDGIETIGDYIESVPFTIRGFGPILKDPRVQFYEAEIENACGRDKAGRKRLEHVAKEGGGFSILAGLRLREPDATSAAEAAVRAAATTAMELYTRGMLASALARTGEARQAFEQGAKASGDDFAHYLNLRALSEMR